MKIRLQTLGDVRVFVDGQELKELYGQRLRCAFLVVLAVQREISREALATLLWPERTDEKARGALKQTLYELRRTLGEDLVDSQNDRLRINSAVEVDLHRFDAALARDDHAEAVRFYHGAFLDHFFLPESKSFESWVDQKRAHYQRLHRTTRRAQINRLSGSGALEEACAEARRWIELEPLEDEAHHGLIQLLARAGHRAEALQQYEQYVRLLASDSLEPLEETIALAQAIRQGRDLPVSPPIEIARPPRQMDTPKPKPQPANSSARWLTLATSAMLLVAVLLVWPAFKPTPGRDIRTLAVLPFENMSANREATEYQSDGLTDALINALTQIKELRVPARTSSFVFRNAPRDIREIGRLLNVDAVVEGTWRLEGNTLRVTAKLTSVRDGYNVWSQEYEIEIKDIFEVQDRIVSAVVKALALELGAAEAARLAARPTQNLTAYDEYLKGLHEFAKGTREGVAGAIKHFDAAIKVDSAFALAYAGLVDAHAMRQAIGSVPWVVTCPVIRNAARRAFALDSLLAKVRSAVARTLWNCEDNLAGAEKEFLRSIEINPNLPLVRSNYGMMLSMVMLRFEDGIRETRYARSLDPLSAIEMNRAANAFRAARLFDSAAILYKRTREIDPTIGNTELNLARVYLAQGRWHDASAILDSVVAGGRNIRRALGMLAFIQARYGSRDSALALLGQLNEMSLQESVWDGIALAYAGLGDDTRTLNALDSGAVNRPANFPILLNEPAMDGVRDSARFQLVLRELGLPHLTVRQRDSLAARLRGR